MAKDVLKRKNAATLDAMYFADLKAEVHRVENLRNFNKRSRQKYLADLAYRYAAFTRVFKLLTQ